MHKKSMIPVPLVSYTYGSKIFTFVFESRQPCCCCSLVCGGEGRKHGPKEYEKGAITGVMLCHAIFGSEIGYVVRTNGAAVYLKMTAVLLLSVLSMI